MFEQNHPSPQQTDSVRVRRIVLQIILLVAAAVTIVWLLFALRSVLLLLAFTIIFCYLVAPLVDFIERPLRIGRVKWQVPRIVAVLIVYVLLIGGVAVALERVVPLLTEQLTAFFESMPTYARHLDQYVKWVTSLPNRYRLPLNLKQSLTDGLNAGIIYLGAWVKLIAEKTLQVTWYLPWLVLIPIIGFFFLKDAKAISLKLLTSFPEADMRYRVARFLKDVSSTLAGYIRAQLMACLLVGVVEGMGLWLLGISYPLVFAVVAGLFEFVPLIGPLFLGIIATLVASFYSWNSALLIAGFLTCYRILHDYLIYPRLISQGVEIHPVVVILAVLSGAELGGVVGVFLSVPVAALLLVSWRHWRELQIDRSSAPVGEVDPSLIEHSSALIGEKQLPLIEDVISQE